MRKSGAHGNRQPDFVPVRGLFPLVLIVQDHDEAGIWIAIDIKSNEASLW